jgi:hypothetical protein
VVIGPSAVSWICFSVASSGLVVDNHSFFVYLAARRFREARVCEIRTITYSIFLLGAICRCRRK